MKVGIDSTPLTVSSGGISRYTAELQRALCSAYPDDEFVFLSDQSESGLSVFEQRWWLYGLPKRLRKMKADLFHGTDYSVPYLPVCPTVMTIHDLSPWLDADWHIGAERIRKRTPRLLRFGLTTMVITDCEAIRKAVIEQFALDPETVVAVPLAAAEHFKPTPAPVSDPYILYVGTLEPRKNLPMLIEAWREVSAHVPVKLILAGRRRQDCPKLAEYPGLEIRGEVPEAELPALYSNAQAVVYPSLYEGFGLPVLEAMACGAPVLTSRDPALVELSAGAAQHADETNRKAWVVALHKLLTHPVELAEMRERGLRRAREFSWKRTAVETAAVYAEAIERYVFRRN